MLSSALRSSLFVVALLATGSDVALLTGAYAYDRGHPLAMFGSGSWSVPFPSSSLSIYRTATGLSGFWLSWLFPLDVAGYCNAKLWGMDFSLFVVLGAWLVWRYDWWRTWHGRNRAILYTTVCFYGSMLTTTTQRWLNDLAPNGYPRGVNGPTGLYANYKPVFHFPGIQINDY